MADLEARIRLMAATGHSRQHTAELLGLDMRKFRAMLGAMGPVAWPGPGASVLARAANDNRRGRPVLSYTPAQIAAREKRKAQYAHTARGVTGTVADLVKHFGASIQVNASSVRRRLSRGMTIDEALFTPHRPSDTQFGRRPRDQ